nr:DNA-directed DNA polymerase [Tanacetum cinerariifolium]
MLRQCPHHRFLDLYQINTFYNGLNEHEQYSLNAAAGGNILRKTPQDALIIIENKSKVCYSQNKPITFKVSTTSSGNSSSTDARIDKLSDTISNLVETFNKKMTTLTMVKAVEETCVICGGAHPYYDCIATDGNISSVCATTGTYNQGSNGFRPQVDREPETITDHVLTESTNNVPPLVVQPSPVSTYFYTISSSKIPEVTKDMVQPSTKNIQPLVAQTQDLIEPVVAPNPKPTIPCPSRANKQKLHEKDDMLALKFVEIFRNLHLKLSFADALLHMPKFALMFKKFLEKLGDPNKFLIPCDFLELDECLALADLGASISLMPLSVWRKLSLPELTFTQMILELVDRSTTRPAGIAEDVFVKVGKFHFPTDFVVVDYVVDPRSDFILEEIETFLQTPDELSDLDDDYYDTEGDILYLEKFLNEDPSHNLLPVKTEDLKQVNATKTKPSIEEPPDFELKELPFHLEYAFLEGTDKLPIIISKELKNEEKSTLLKVLKLHKRAIAWKISDIKGIDPPFCTYKILMKDGFIPVVQHQRRVNLKIHVIKLLDAGLIYPISDSPWISPVHCVPKKGGITVVKNEDNELIPT